MLCVSVHYSAGAGRFRIRRMEPQPEAQPSDPERMARLLHELADRIGDDDEIDRFWQSKVRRCAALAEAGKPAGLQGFLQLFGSMGSINDQRFSGVLQRELSAAHALAGSLLRESAPAEDPEVVLNPWTEGKTGKAVVWADGTVIATADETPGTPAIEDIKRAAGLGPDVAAMGVAPDGTCDVYSYGCDERWLANRLHDHHPALHLGPMQDARSFTPRRRPA